MRRNEVAAYSRGNEGRDRSLPCMILSAARVRTSYIRVIVALSALLFASSANATNLCGNVSGTLPLSDSPYSVICDVTVPTGQTLAIEPGVIIRFTGKYYFLVYGSLTAQGTATAPITFTSAAAVPARGDWNSLGLCGPSTLAFTRVEYGQGLVVSCGADVLITDSTVAFSQYDGAFLDMGVTGTISRCAFEDNVGDGITTMGPIGTGFSVSDCSFDRNYESVMLNPDAFLTLSNLTVHPNQTTGNGGVGLSSAGWWGTSGTLTDAGVPYVIRDGPLVFNPLATLTLEAGVVVKSDGWSLDLCGLATNGTVDRPVVFTSYKDDSVGGDTNGDGPSVGTACDWPGITLQDCSGSQVTNASIRYACTGLTATGVSVTLDGTQIEACTIGAYFNNFAGGTIRRSTFIGNGTGVMVGDFLDLNLGSLNDADPNNDGENQFLCNTVHLENQSSQTLLAENNWWGQDPPDAAKILGPIDYTPPAAGLYQDVLTTLKVARTNGEADILLQWDHQPGACQYTVLRAASPTGAFQDVSGPLTGATFTDLGTGSIQDSYFYKVAIQ